MLCDLRICKTIFFLKQNCQFSVGPLGEVLWPKCLKRTLNASTIGLLAKKCTPAERNRKVTSELVCSPFRKKTIKMWLSWKFWFYRSVTSVWNWIFAPVFIHFYKQFCCQCNEVNSFKSGVKYIETAMIKIQANLG